MLGNRRHQVLSIHRLRQVIIAARIRALLAVLIQGVGSQRNDRVGAAHVPKQGGGLVAVHDGHLHVRENHVKRFARFLRRQRRL
jgi:hypothetical protein